MSLGDALDRAYHLRVSLRDRFDVVVDLDVTRTHPLARWNVSTRTLTISLCTPAQGVWALEQLHAALSGGATPGYRASPALRLLPQPRDGTHR